MGDARRLRAVGAVACSFVLTATLAGPSLGQPAPADDVRKPPVQRSLAGAEVTPFRSLPGAASDQLRASGFADEVCPTGTVVGRTVQAENFETGMPDPEFTEGWSHISGSGASGSGYASSGLPDWGRDNYHFFYLRDSVAPRGSRTFLTAATRGNWESEGMVIWANDTGGVPTPSEQWSYGWMEITEALDDYGDNLFISVDHFGTSDETSVAEVDDMRVFTCVPPAASGVRGDWTGEGTVDVLGTLADGSLYLYPGTGTGSVGSGWKVGSGWGSMTWVGSPGDVDGDRRSDLLARRSDGTVWFYRGRGAGTFAAGVQFGSGWNSMTAIATPGDLDGDGYLDLVARRSDGTLHLYRLTKVGGRYTGQIGSGWNGMRLLVGMGDMNGDRRGDIIGVHQDGRLFGYAGSRSGLANMGQIGSGWGGMDLVASPGDMNRDGRGDVIARRFDGTLWFYPGRAAGVGSGKQIGSGWGGMTRIL